MTGVGLFLLFFAPRRGHLQRNGLFLQLFLSMDLVPVISRDVEGTTGFPRNDTEPIRNLLGAFSRYTDLQFELVMGCELNNLDVV